MKSSVIKSGAALDRGVKTSGHLVIGRNARVEGGVIAIGDLTLGANAAIEGRVSVDGDLVMGPGSTIEGEAEVRGTAHLLPGSSAAKLVAKTVEVRNASAREVHSRGDLVLVDSEVNSFEAEGRVVAKR